MSMSVVLGGCLDQDRRRRYNGGVGGMLACIQNIYCLYTVTEVSRSALSRHYYYTYKKNLLESIWKKFKDKTT